MDKLKILELLVDLAEQESDRTWTRYSMMLYANTGLVAVLSLTLNSTYPIAAIIPSLLGIANTFAWLKVNTASYYYEHRWHADIEALVESDENLTEWVRGRNRPRISRPFTSMSGASYFNIVPFSFLALWILVLAVVILGILWEPFRQYLYSVGPVAGAS